MEKIYYKLLNKDGTSSNGGKSSFKYALPQDGKPGKWTRKTKGVKHHVVELHHILGWRGELLCTAEIRGGEYIDDGTKIVAEQIRLVSVVEGWNEKNLRLFAADCAERVLAIFERRYPNDDRPRRAIEAVRKFAHGEITIEELRIAADAVVGTPHAPYTPYTSYAHYATNAAKLAAADACCPAAIAAATSAATSAATAKASNAAAQVARGPATASAYAEAHDDERRAQYELLRKYLNTG